MEFEHKIADYLLQINAIKLEPTKPFTWASGWKSPIYCDNRLILSDTLVRMIVKSAFCELMQSRFPKVEVVAGVATGAIAHAALVAHTNDLPMVYVRSSAKEHGTKSLIEGKLEPGKKVVVIEDLVSTGMSSLKAVEALREAGADEREEQDLRGPGAGARADVHRPHPWNVRITADVDDERSLHGGDSPGRKVSIQSG
ncbi:MAG: orotate phosphoribosyltransferase, partial [Bacteroidales bacterium]|nr:orotate phosphoribosyltransferase [Bacteroidales bacterium]